MADSSRDLQRHKEQEVGMDSRVQGSLRLARETHSVMKTIMGLFELNSDPS